MALSPIPEDHQWRLDRIAFEYGISDPPPPAPLDKSLPSSPLSPSFRTSNDDFLAEELLKRRRINNIEAAQNSQGGIKRAFTPAKTKKGWETKEIFDALDCHVTNAGSPGVAEALVARLLSAGGDMNVANAKSKTNLLTRRKSMETFERSRILQKAIELRQPALVAVLAPHADPLTLDTSLPLAIRTGSPEIAAMLLRYGASAAQTADGQDAFRHLCLAGGQAELVQLILTSDGRPSPSWVSQAMIDAARKGCVETVLHLSRSTADGNYDDAAALKEAIRHCRVDIALAVLTGAKPPAGETINQAFLQLFTHPSVMPNDKLALADILLCAGARGDVVSNALIQACMTEFSEMVELLISHGASIEYQDASVLRSAIALGKLNLVHLLLTETSALSPIYASECVECIPKRIDNEERHALLSLLLRKGASGAYLHDALIDATEVADLESVKLLLTPHFPGPGRLADRHDLRKGPRGTVHDRHETASVDHRGGLALQIAVLTANVPAVKLMLASGPSPETMGEVFPSIGNLSPIDRYQMAECFLSTGLSGPCVHAALQQAIDERPPRRDESLIALLLRHNADVNFNDGAGILAAVAHQDLNLLETLLQNRPTPQTAAVGIPGAMAAADLTMRAKMISLLLAAGAGRGGLQVPEALVNVLQGRPTDTRLLDILLKGNADINFDSGRPVMLAVQNPDPQVLELVLHLCKATPESLSRGFEALSNLPSTTAKADKLESILRRTKQKDALDSLLVTEVQTVLKTEPQQRIFTVISSLLSCGADVNAHNGAALCHAVAAANTQIADMLFAARPTATSLAAATPLALHIRDPMDRLTFTQKLLQAGAPGAEANRALVYAVEAIPNDLPLISALLAKAEAGGGEALQMAVKKEKGEIVHMLLTRTRRKYAKPTLDAVFVEAAKGSDQDERRTICELLLRAGASGPVVSDALLSAASDGDLALGTLLLQFGASVDHQDGRAVIEACRSGSPAVLRMLLSSPAATKPITLAQGFQAATEVSDLARRGDIFRLLLEQGVHGEVVDGQLVSAARFGDDGIDLVRLLLEFGCDTDYNSGEAVWTATRSAFLPSLQLMLGIVNVGGRQRKPSQATMTRALKASWRLSGEPRFQVINWLFQAGMPVTEDVHVGLNKAVSEDEPNVSLIQLLVDRGASPLANGCQTLIDATRKLVVPAIDVFMKSEIPQADLDWTFSQGLASENADTWLSEDGHAVARALLAKGAGGEGPSNALVIAVEACGTEKDAIARRFVELMIENAADVNGNGGQAVRSAATLGDTRVLRQVLAKKPTGESLSLAFPHIFDSDISEEAALELINLFSSYGQGEERLDPMFVHPTCEPVVVRALSQHPRSTKIIQALFDVGYYHDQTVLAQVMPEVEEDEQVSLLFWALLQPQKKISSGVIDMLIEKGGKVNFETRLSKTTPLMLAIRSRRLDVVRSLVLAGAEVDITDVTGNTPLTLSAKIGGEQGTSMMSYILAADPSKNDGSLHDAARELSLQAMKILVEYGHEVDFPSPLHGGRSALGEICLHASGSGELTAAREKAMEKAMAFLLDQGTDLSLKCDGKSVLLLALEAAEPIPTTRALLKVGLWKHINSRYHHYSDGTYTYSPTMYLSRVLPASDTQEQLLALLKANRAENVYYANSGPQPDGAVGLPDELLRAERERMARLDRIGSEKEEHARALARTKELANIQNQIFVNRAEIEDARARRVRSEDIEGMRQKAAVEEDIFSTAAQRQRAERVAALEHNQTMAQAELARARLLGESEIELDGRKQLQMLEWERQVGSERVDNAKQMSAVRVTERGDIERYDRENDQRIRGRIAEQKKLVDSQGALAGQLTNAGVNGRRQIGYIAGELN